MGSHVDLLLGLLQQMKDGMLSHETLEVFLALPEEERVKRLSSTNKTKEKKFELLVDLGEIIVPENYMHQNRLANFCKENKQKFFNYDISITDERFPNPSRILTPGDRLWVRVFKQTVGGRTTSEERMAFLRSQEKAVFVGAQGASLVWEQKRLRLLGKGYWYQSFDEKERLWTVSKDNHRVPGLGVDPGGYFIFYLGCFEEDADQECSILSFCEVP